MDYVTMRIVTGRISSNCYLIKGQSGFILIDTGLKSKRSLLERVLNDAGCIPQKLNLIILTHGDFDHSGNAVYRSQKYASPVAMHQDDVIVVEKNEQA